MMTKLFQDSKESAKKEWLTLFFIAAISAAIRLHTNLSTDFIPGNNGAYYLIMVRSMLENGKLIQHDFPLLFWLEAAISFVVIKLGLANFNSAIDLTSRVFDSLIPTLSIIPAYLLTKKIISDRRDWIIVILIASGSILYYSFLVLVSDFQKNSLGLLWLFWLIYFLFRVHEKASVKNILGAFAFLILTGLTHYGCIAVGLTIIVVDLLCRHFFRYSLKRFLKLLILILISIGLIVGLIYQINPWRLKTFIRIPFEIFNNPIIGMIIQKEPVITPIDVLSLILLNGIALSVLYIFVTRFEKITEKHRSFILSMILLLMFLASPFLDVEFAQRVYFISYLTAVPLVSFIYKFLSGESNKKYFILFISIIIFLSVVLSAIKPNYSNMNKNLYTEYQTMRNSIPVDDRTAIIARHGLEFWSTWILGCDAYRQESVWPVYWSWYKNVYLLRQKKDKPPFGPAGIYGVPFPEPELPEGSYLVYSCSYFDLYRAPKSPTNYIKYNKQRY